MRKIKNMEPVPKLKKRNSGTGSEINTKAFTLIELLVVITILATLATIGFLSFQSYNVFARDSVRLWNLKTLESSLWIQYVQSWNYALPDDSVNITASWTIIRKQWLFWKNALRTVWVSKNWSTDPLTQEYFDYSVWDNLQEYQLVAYLEWDETNNSGQAQGIAPTSYANIWTMKSMWQDLWIVFSWWVELHKTASNIWNDFDIRKAWDEYTVKFSEWDEITSSWSLLFSSIYNHSKNLLKNKELAKLDDSLVLYFDMETTTQSWSLTVLKDFSKYDNHWECYDWNNLKNCWEWWPVFEQKWIKFDGVNDYIEVKDHSSLDLSNELSILSYVNLDNDIWDYSLLTKWDRSIDSQNYEMIVRRDSYNWHKWLWFVSWDWNDWYNVYSNKSFLDNNVMNYFYSITYDNLSENVKLYENWKIIWLDNNYTYKIEPDNYPLRIWNRKYSSPNEQLNWTIHEVRIYNRALSEEEIKNVYGSTLNN